MPWPSKAIHQKVLTLHFSHYKLITGFDIKMFFLLSRVTIEHSMAKETIFLKNICGKMSKIMMHFCMIRSFKNITQIIKKCFLTLINAPYEIIMC